MKYGFIKGESPYFPVTVLCRVMQVKRSSYYDWKTKRFCRITSAEELELRREMKRLFAESRQSLGSRKMCATLRKQGVIAGRYKVRQRMKSMSLVVKQKRRFRVTTDSRHHLPIADNVLNREFNPAKANQTWSSDITYVWTAQGWLYLAVVIDLFSRRVIDWCVDTHMQKSLVIRALTMAINLRQPAGELTHHSDRGSQYASKDYRRILTAHGITASMSRKGNCWDNSPVERFFGSLKREWIVDNDYRTREEAINDIREYVAVYYNSKRLHSTLEYMTPLEFEKCA